MAPRMCRAFVNSLKCAHCTVKCIKLFPPKREALTFEPRLLFNYALLGQHLENAISQDPKSRFDLFASALRHLIAFFKVAAVWKQG